MRTLLLLACLAAACGGSSAAVSDPSGGTPAAPSGSAVAEGGEPRQPLLPPGTVYRSAVKAFVAEGIPAFLSRVQVEPIFDDIGAFGGWRILELRDAEFWSGVDLIPGDVILRVNGRSLERDTEAFDVFQSLSTTEAIRVRFLRDGMERELVIQVVEDTPPASAAAGGAVPSAATPSVAPAAVPSAGPAGAPSAGASTAAPSSAAPKQKR